jgi:hypothetical protein
MGDLTLFYLSGYGVYHNNDRGLKIFIIFR